MKDVGFGIQHRGFLRKRAGLWFKVSRIGLAGTCPRILVTMYPR